VDGARQQHHRQGAGEKQEIELGMLALGHPVQLAADADHQEKTHGEQNFNHLGEQIDLVGLAEQQPLRFQGRQADDDRQCRRD
jgi:hypothetical protein